MNKLQTIMVSQSLAGFFAAAVKNVVQNLRAAKINTDASKMRVSALPVVIGDVEINKSPNHKLLQININNLDVPIAARTEIELEIGSKYFGLVGPKVVPIALECVVAKEVATYELHINNRKVAIDFRGHDTNALAVFNALANGIINILDEKERVSLKLAQKENKLIRPPADLVLP